jgi:hypothetical protein
MTDLRVDLETGKVVCSSTRVRRKTYARYLEDHYTLPEAGGASVSVERLLGMLEAAESSGAPEDWRRALIHLAHHRSEAASGILAELEAKVPRGLRDYWELAHAESVGWLGSEFYRDDDGVAHVVPAGTIFGTDDAEQRPLN